MYKRQAEAGVVGGQVQVQGRVEGADRGGVPAGAGLLVGGLLRRGPRPQVPGQFVLGVVLGVGEVVGEGAAVQGIAVFADLRPQAEEPVPGLFAVARVVQHHDLTDPCQHGVRRRLPLSLRHHVLRTRSPAVVPRR